MTQQPEVHADALVVISRRGAKHLAALFGEDQRRADQAVAILGNALAKQRRELAARVRDEAFAVRRGGAAAKGDGSYTGGLLRAARLVEGGQRREDQAQSQVRAVRKLHRRYVGPDGLDYCEHCNRLTSGWVPFPCETIQAIGGGE